MPPRLLEVLLVEKHARIAERGHGGRRHGLERPRVWVLGLRSGAKKPYSVFAIGFEAFALPGGAPRARDARVASVGQQIKDTRVLYSRRNDYHCVHITDIPFVYSYPVMRVWDNIERAPAAVVRSRGGQESGEVRAVPPAALNP